MHCHMAQGITAAIVCKLWNQKDHARVRGGTRLSQETFAMGSARRITLRVKPPVPLGEVAVVPAPLSGRPEAEMARAMAAALADDESTSAADVYSRVQQAFPFAPLSARLGALAVLMDKIRRPAH
jgi:hypothetical protein